MAEPTLPRQGFSVGPMHSSPQQRWSCLTSVCHPYNFLLQTQRDLRC